MCMKKRAVYVKKISERYTCGNIGAHEIQISGEVGSRVSNVNRTGVCTFNYKFIWFFVKMVSIQTFT